ncbi:17934_t:CDS:2 [Dentiscutata erythropus]|uniref:17934_t:CDS:1 n=1 Tax=Dentiscutata erythropus TaxID=1348616 RepID=A0A9N8ZK59_9GLOM|nr:17934_t:CDS:2 [Dentiscutata erythropus]
MPTIMNEQQLTDDNTQANPPQQQTKEKNVTQSMDTSDSFVDIQLPPLPQSNSITHQQLIDRQNPKAPSYSQ